MKHLIYRSLFIGLLALSSACKTNSSSSSVTSIEEQPETKSEITLMSEGYVKATVLDKNDLYDCGFLLRLEKDGRMLYPRKLVEGFNKDQLKVWILYRPIRPIQANCPDVIPIYIEDIQKRTN